MKRVLAASLSILLLAAPVPAHHSYSATYDGERQVTLQGVVTRIEWVNPHAYLFVDDAESDGTVTNWAVEVGRPFDLERAAFVVAADEEETLSGADDEQRAHGPTLPKNVL